MAQDTFRSIAVIGSGALGINCGARLALGGADTRFLLRSDFAAVRERGSLLIHEKTRTLELRPVSAFRSAEEIGPVDLVMVTIKSTANDQLKRLLPPLLGPNTAIFTLQNGIGGDEELAANFGRERVLGGLGFIAATRTAPGVVTCFNPGSITLGEFDRRPLARTQAWAAQLTEAGLITQVVENLLEARWRKLVWNIPFNGLGVVYNQTTDRLCADPQFASEVRVLMKEVQLAAQAYGFEIADAFLEEQFDMTPPMRAYQPSSLVDFRAGRELEIEPIWGEPLRRAKARGVHLPHLNALYANLLRVGVTLKN